MADNEVLPFPRGSTWSDWDSSVTAGSGEGLVGRTFVTKDTEHSTNVPVTVRVVRNDSGGSITTAKKCLGFGTAAKDFGRNVKAQASVAAGEVCKPMDDAMTADKSIVANDLFYVVEEGPCYIVHTSTAASISQHANVTVAAGGTLGAAEAGDTEFIIGILDEAATTGDADSNGLVWVKKGLTGIAG